MWLCPEGGEGYGSGCGYALREEKGMAVGVAMPCGRRRVWQWVWLCPEGEGYGSGCGYALRKEKGMAVGVAMSCGRRRVWQWVWLCPAGGYGGGCGFMYKQNP